jgi:hypothetical protein
MHTVLPRPAVSYEIRYCAFVDVLGFSNLIADLAKGKISHETVRAILQRVHKPPLEIARQFANCDFKAQSISDAVCVSTAATPTGLAHLLQTLSALTQDLLYEGYFCRGGVVKGKLYHQDDVVFGEALVHAYRLESTIAKYPRIILPREVALEAKQLKEAIPKEDYVRQSGDGAFFVHTLLPMTDPPSPDLQSSFDEYWNGMGATIQRLFDESVDNPRHFEKVQWFATYWNFAAAQTTSIELVKGPTHSYLLGDS